MMTTGPTPRQRGESPRRCGPSSPRQNVASTAVGRPPGLRRGVGGAVLAVLLAALAGNAAGQESPKSYGLHPVTPFQVLTYDATPARGDEGRPMSISACRGEYEPATFLIRAGKNLKKVRVTAGDLKDKDGHSIPAGAIDIRVMKVWYQGGEMEGFGQTPLGKGSKELLLVPELLLKDDGLIDIDVDKKTNVFHFEGIPVDGPDLKPVAVPANTSKQFWLTVKVPEGAAAGTYSSKVTVSPANARAAEIELKVTVLPFTLRKPEKVYSVYYYGPTMFYYGSGRQGRLAELEDMRAHGMNSASMYTYYYDTRVRKNAQGTWEVDLAPLKEALDLRVKAGLTAPTVFSLSSYICRDTAFRRLWTADAGMTAENEAKLTQVIRQLEKFVKDNRYPQLLYYGVDEPTGPRLARCTRIFDVIHRAGGKTTTAVYDDQLGNIDVPIYALPMANRLYENPELPRKPHEMELHYWHPLENPSVDRFRYGFLTWFAGLDGASSYAYRHVFQSDNPYYDESKGPVNPKQNRNMMYTYPSRTGPVPTIQWEAVREGIDDVRYLTTLAHWVDKCEDATGNEAVARAKRKGLELLNTPPEAFTRDRPVKTNQYRYGRDLEANDFHDYRRQVIEQILVLQRLLEPK